MILSDIISFGYTSHDWQLGIQVTFPSTSKEFHSGVKLRVPFGVTLYVGPFLVDFRGELKTVAFKCAACGFTHTGEPGWEGPMPGLLMCADCHAKAKERGGMIALTTHQDGCDGSCGMEHSGPDIA